ncbi:MAG: nucleotide exchange factor GrpE, partial [Synechococcales cyanobacterium CRU_2_2]|nr:nucleotide exchange factor GrpE [Synechococcales cyanobacterium CRU_2_2]
SLGIVAWDFLAVGLVVTPLMLLVMHLKGEWNVNPGDVLQANPTLLLEKGETVIGTGEGSWQEMGKHRSKYQKRTGRTPLAAEGYQDGDVFEELRRGYMLGDRLLRPSMVKVAKGGQ